MYHLRRAVPAQFYLAIIFMFLEATFVVVSPFNLFSNQCLLLPGVGSFGGALLGSQFGM